MFVFIILYIFRPSLYKRRVNSSLNVQDSHNNKFVKEMNKKCAKKRKQKQKQNKQTTKHVSFKDYKFTTKE